MLISSASFNILSVVQTNKQVLGEKLVANTKENAVWQSSIEKTAGRGLELKMLKYIYQCHAMQCEVWWALTICQHITTTPSLSLSLFLLSSLASVPNYAFTRMKENNNNDYGSRPN